MHTSALVGFPTVQALPAGGRGDVIVRSFTFGRAGASRLLKEPCLERFCLENSQAKSIANRVCNLSAALRAIGTTLRTSVRATAASKPACDRGVVRGALWGTGA